MKKERKYFWPFWNVLILLVFSSNISAQPAEGWKASKETVDKLSKPGVEFNYYAGKVAVVGHSRGGKTALWAGAEDQRFALVVSNESGCGGAALARRKYGETVARINTAFPHWFCTNYKKYSNNESSLPVDMHMLLVLTAPRALYVDCASDDLWGDPRGSYLSLYHAAPVFTLLGKNSLLPESMPPLNKQIVSGNVGFHIRDGVHNMLLKDWSWFMDFADNVLK